MSTLEGLVITSTPQWTLGRLIEQYQVLCDVVRVVVDMDAEDANLCMAAARRHGIEPRKTKTGGYLETVLSHIYASTTCGWVMRLDDDELLSQALAQQIRTLMDSGNDYYHIARAHCVDPEAHIYIHTGFLPQGPNADWWPNYQLRLFRRDHCMHQGHLHEGPIGIGKGGYIEAPILHFNTAKPRPEREAVVARYKRLNGITETRGDTALFEDYPVQYKVCQHKIWEPTREVKCSPIHV